jgi:hypothetical protein
MTAAEAALPQRTAMGSAPRQKHRQREKGREGQTDRQAGRQAGRQAHRNRSNISNDGKSQVSILAGLRSCMASQANFGTCDESKRALEPESYYLGQCLYCSRMIGGIGWLSYPLSLKQYNTEMRPLPANNNRSRPLFFEAGTTNSCKMATNPLLTNCCARTPVLAVVRASDAPLTGADVYVTPWHRPLSIWSLAVIEWTFMPCRTRLGALQGCNLPKQARRLHCRQARGRNMRCST